MSAYSDILTYLLGADGVNQFLRLPPALKPASIGLDERNQHDLLAFMAALAPQVQYYNELDQPHGDWYPFFDALRDAGHFINAARLEEIQASRSDWPPHLALMLAFLEAFAHAQQDLNALTEQHADYYYSKVLRLARRGAQPDQLHVVFEPTKNAKPTRVPSGALLAAGQLAGDTPHPLHYAIDSEIIVNQAKVHSLKSLLVERNHKGGTEVRLGADATQIKRDVDVGWRPFGMSKDVAGVDDSLTEVATPGFALASPELRLAEGHRGVTVTIDFANTDLPPEQNLAPFLELTVTGEEGWIMPNRREAHFDENGRLVLFMEIDETQPAVVPHQEALHEGGYDTEWPVLQCSIKKGNKLFDEMTGLEVQAATIHVSASGVRSLIVQNDESLQAVDSKILPFGSQPRINGSFYIGSQEAFSKQLTGLSVTVEWEDPPGDFATHYADYDNALISNNVFTTDVYLRAAKNWDTRLLTNQSLFNWSTEPVPRTFGLHGDSFAAQIVDSGYIRQPHLETADRFSQAAKQGFIQFTLTGPTQSELGNAPAYAPFEAFGHKSYPAIYARKALEISQSSPPPPPPDLPLVPYTPAIKSLSLFYEAEVTFNPSQPNGTDQFYIKGFFGPKEIEQSEPAHLVPALPGEGALFIGLEGGSAPQLHSLLFQIEEGSVLGSALVESEALSWSYLAGNRWQALSAQDVIEDATNALQKPGLIRVNMGEDATTSHSLMPAGLHWLRLSTASRPDGASAILDIQAQAARATLAIEHAEAAYESHLQQPLGPETVTGLKKRIAGIKNVQQPYPSFSGRPQEASETYFLRASERLRHRNRAVSTWDYERLILEAFPEIYKVKCLPHLDEENAFAPGHVRAVVVPDWRLRGTGNPLQPAANPALLRTIETWLSSSKSNAFSNIHVTNPTYETLLVDCDVAFNEGYDPGFYALQLEEDLKRFLSPWAYEEGQDIVFGGKIYKSEIQAFIEGRPYVNYVVDFKLYHRHNSGPIGGIGTMTIGLNFIVAPTPVQSIGTMTINEDFIIGKPVEIAAATRPDAILVSNGHHRIGILQADQIACEGVQQVGIGDLVIGLDFVLVS